MAWVGTDWDITRSTGAIRYVGDDHGGASPSYVTVIDFRRELGKFADDAASSGDDEYDITDPTAADRKTDNYIVLLGSYNIDDVAMEHIYDGSIQQGTGGTEVIYDGIVNYGNSDVQLQIHQNGAVLADDWWNFSAAGLNPDATNGISHRFMLKVRDAGADIDGRRLLGTCRRFNKTYSEFPINGTSRGNNTLALKDATDLNNTTVTGTVATWDKFANDNEGYFGIDVNNDAADEYYFSSLDIGAGTLPVTPTINDLFEWWKHETRDGSSGTLYGIDSELFRGITHEIDVDGITSGPLSAFEELSWDGGDSTAQMLATNSVSAPSKIWVQMLTGVVPVNDETMTGGTSGASIDMDTTIVSRTISTPSIGASTGAAIIGAYGIGVDTTDLTQNDKLFDLTNTQYSPPNITTKGVGGLVVGEDYVLVTNNDAGDIDYAQMTLNGALTTTTTTVTVTGAIPVDTPTSGTIRIERDSGAYTRHPYSAWTGSVFTITSHNFTTDNASNTNNTFISYLDLLAGSALEEFLGEFGVSRTYFIRVRDGGGTPIKTYESTITDTGSGASTTAIRTTDE